MRRREKTTGKAGMIEEDILNDAPRKSFSTAQYFIYPINTFPS